MKVELRYILKYLKLFCSAYNKGDRINTVFKILEIGLKLWKVI